MTRLSMYAVYTEPFSRPNTDTVATIIGATIAKVKWRVWG